jgi:hypothetical protein
LTQSSDSDSSGATVWSILSAYFGPEGLDERWLAPFNDDLRTGLARFYERSLVGAAKRMGELPGQIANELTQAQ